MEHKSSRESSAMMTEFRFILLFCAKTIFIHAAKSFALRPAREAKSIRRMFTSLCSRCDSSEFFSFDISFASWLRFKIKSFYAGKDWKLAKDISRADCWCFLSTGGLTKQNNWRLLLERRRKQFHLVDASRRFPIMSSYLSSGQQTKISAHVIQTNYSELGRCSSFPWQRKWKCSIARRRLSKTKRIQALNLSRQLITNWSLYNCFALRINSSPCSELRTWLLTVDKVVSKWSISGRRANASARAIEEESLTLKAALGSSS